MTQYINQSLQRAMQIMELIANHANGMTLTEVCRAANLNKTIAYRLLMTLLNGGWLIRDQDNRFKTGIKLITMFYKALDESGFSKLALPFIEELAEKFGETVVLTVYSNYSAICVEKYESENPIRITSQIGRAFPVYAGATGLSVLMGMSEEVSREVLEHYRDSENADFDVESTLSLLRDSRQQGYIITSGMVDEGVVAIGIPISFPLYEQYFSLSVIGPEYRFTEEKVTAIAQALKDAMASIPRQS